MNKKKHFIIITSAVAILAAVILTTYLYILPNVISSKFFWNFAQKIVRSACKAELVIEQPVLKTYLRPHLVFNAKTIKITKNNERIFDVDDFNSQISFKNILLKQILVEKFGADELYLDVNKLLSLSMKQQVESKPSAYKIRLYNAELYLKKCTILYNPKPNVKLKLQAHDLEITKERDPKYIHFSIMTDIQVDDRNFKLLFKDFDTIYFKDDKLNIDKFQFVVDRVFVNINGFIDKNNNYNIEISSKNFDIKNIKSALDSNLIIPNGKDVLACFKDLAGTFDFIFKFSNKNLAGSVNLHKIIAKLIPLADLPFEINGGNIVLDSQNIKVNKISGFYGTNKSNIIDFYGDVKNYTKTADTSIILTGDANDELAKYISKIAQCKINLINTSKIGLKIDYDYSGKVTVSGGFKIPKGSDILIESMPISSNKFDRALGIKINMLKNLLEIEHINYYISDYISDKSRPTSEPIVTLNSKMDIKSGIIKELAFNVPKPLPSEFFNALINQKLFRNGTFSGNLKYNNNDEKHPKIEGYANLADVIVNKTGILIKSAKITTDKNDICINSNGSIRRAKYDFVMKIQNKILCPIIVKDATMSFDKLDVERILQTFAPRPELTKEQREKMAKRRAEMKIARSDISTKYFEVTENSITQADTDDDAPTQINFIPNIIAIRSCKFKVKEGSYKLINFGNLDANMTLAESGILEIKSNRFDFAEGISTLKLYCDLVQQKYSIRLGAKDVDTDAIASSVLNLPKEISGKAKALLEFNTDSSMKLNGRIQFEVNDGSITKLGLVQYILHAAAIFRNPIVMISPSTLLDLVNVPDGTFKKIKGDMKLTDNKIERMLIKSSSPQLSAVIFGKIDLETFDSSLRIYTKFSGKNSGLAGVLRTLSLNALAKKSHQVLSDTRYYESEMSFLPKLETGDDVAQIFLTKVDGDIQTNNFISSLRKIK